MNGVASFSFQLDVPDSIHSKVEISKPYQNVDARGNPSSFGIDLTFKELGFFKNLKSREFHLLRGKIEDTLRTWEAKYQRHSSKLHTENRAAHATSLNKEAQEAIQNLENILTHTLAIDDTVNWNAIKRKDTFRVRARDLFPGKAVPEYLEFTPRGKPTDFIPIPAPGKPTLDQVKQEFGWLTRLLFSSKIQQELDSQLADWVIKKDAVNDQNIDRESELSTALDTFNTMKAQFDEEKRQDNEALESIRSRYLEQDSTAVEEYCDLVLTASKYPDYFPQNWQLEYRKESRIIVVEFELPSPDKLPTVLSYQYVKSRDEITEKLIPAATQKKLFEGAIYQTCIRTIHELFEADSVDALDAVAFNGLVTSRNPATGISETKVIMSIVASKSEFMQFDLSQIDPRATFKHLKGVSAAKLIDLTPIPPVIQLDRSDRRFIDSKNVVGHLDESVNLAAMDWEEFEHLVRELFEKEFAANGGEVRVTQASSDGGVDAIAFDPDPIRGGKIVIQAKRYTNTVGVAAVRDLYGTVMNEGATKGILVTTSDFGRDSYEFVKDKPLTLLSGGNLLSLLSKHGHKARINISEAKITLGK